MTNEDRPSNSEEGNERLSDLHYDAESEDWSRVGEAIRAGQDVNGVDIEKWTPLLWVVDIGRRLGNGKKSSQPLTRPEAISRPKIRKDRLPCCGPAWRGTRTWFAC